jgi:hypothetical protein
MTGLEKQRRRDDIEAAATNLREVINRSVPQTWARHRAIDKVRAAASVAKKAIMQETCA